MSNSLVIQSTISEVRVALLEDSSPVEVYIERKAERGVVGNVYRGRVVRVLPGMQAAFVELGLARTGFLYVNDAVERACVPEPENKEGEESSSEGASSGVPVNRGLPVANIADVLTEGQEILVQVQKEPLGTKGARLTRHITIPGRNLVYMPFSDHVGVSLRIADLEERERLRLALEEIQTEGCGFIIRTAAEGADVKELQEEATMLEKIWRDIEAKGASGPVPGLVFSDLDLALRATRDLFAGGLSVLHVDTREDYERVCEFVESFEPGAAQRVELYDKKQPIFDAFGIDTAINRALQRKVWLKSGGHIVIDQAEALTVVDVNSGGFVGKSSLEDTITHINLEAVKELAYQIRLRNIGGIVIIDFIDMALEVNREKVLEALEVALSKDKAKTNIVRMSEIGLVEMTRKRVRESLGNTLTEGCPYCKARGFVKSEQTMVHEILGVVTRRLSEESAATVTLRMNSGVAECLGETESRAVEEIETRYQTQLVPEPRDDFHREHFEVVCDGAN